MEWATYAGYVLANQWTSTPKNQWMKLSIARLLLKARLSPPSEKAMIPFGIIWEMEVAW